MNLKNYNGMKEEMQPMCEKNGTFVDIRDDNDTELFAKYRRKGQIVNMERRKSHMNLRDMEITLFTT